jgi:hypothetical protein
MILFNHDNDVIESRRLRVRQTGKANCRGE